MKDFLKAQIGVAVLLVLFGIGWEGVVHSTTGSTDADGNYTEHTNTGTIVFTVMIYYILALGVFLHCLKYTRQPEPPAGGQFKYNHVPVMVGIFLSLNSIGLWCPKFWRVPEKRPVIVASVGFMLYFSIWFAYFLRRIPENEHEREDAAELDNVEDGTRAD